MALFKRDRVLALDIGASKAVLAEFGLLRDGGIELLRYGIESFGGDPGADADQLAYIAAGIKSIMRSQGMQPAPLVMSVSGQSVFPRYVKLPPVGHDKVEQIIRYEAEQNVPFPIQEVVWDYQLLGGEGGERNVMLVAVKTDAVRRLTDAVQAADLEPEIVDVAPMALYNAVRYNYPDLPDCTMVLDIGARSSNLIFLQDSRIFSRSIPVAGNAVTHELMKEFEVDFAEAENLKRELGFVAFGGVYAGADNETADRVSKIIRSVLTRLHAEVNRSINFYRSQQGGSLPSTVLLTGGSSMIPHVDTFFADKLKVPVEYFNPFGRVAVSAEVDTERLNDDLQCMGEVVGLALRRTESCPVEINLMPPELVALKVFRRRKPYFAASAAGVVLLMLVWCGYFFKAAADYEARVERVQKETRAFDQTKKNLEQATAGREAAAARFAEVAELIVSRSRWMEILAGVRDCMQQGMWVTAVTPEVDGQKIVRVEITLQAFSDRLKDNEHGTASERLRNRLRSMPLFKESSEIVSEMAVGSHLRRFAIRLELVNPINVQ